MTGHLVPEWLIVGALVTTPRLQPFGYSGPYGKGTFNQEGQVYEVVRIVFSSNYGGGIGVQIQTTGGDRRYMGHGKWVGYGHLRPARVRVALDSSP